jgi:hypothetical protein
MALPSVYFLTVFRFIRFKTAFNFGVLYLKTIVGKIFKNKFTVATGTATV